MLSISSELLGFLRLREGTVEVIDRAPPSDEQLVGLVKEAMEREKSLVSGLRLGDDMKYAIDVGLTNASSGLLYPAEVAVRFFLERGSLCLIASRTTELYIKALRERAWHAMVDDGYIVRSGPEAVGRVKKLSGRKSLEGDAIFLAGKPVCERHLKWPEYSKPIEELPLEKKYLKATLDTRKRKKGSAIRCAFCNREARYFTLPMIKASALVFIASYLAGLNPEGPMELYSNLSRVLHPYGFSWLRPEAAFTVWARDMLTAAFYVNSMLGFPLPRVSPRKAPAEAALEQLLSISDTDEASNAPA
ncbi:hypothetical protein ASAC_1407 [Acidilobus saccharovorans 345-15]|uniref:Uncharacterized protein n=1 Tax=Acidilobus saccharovorans (strain DSM 16705 / JCM 18335 / VKM B-2471 / 345-15) TaxID=666510 RepID=D9PZ25_ACIS3|nr:hypothetical protein [Acidilobus saccharovorans]ADL19812.1 hypothetical protein ASAC_1407 [Acidilobus saccharovorans 345-15]